MPKFELRVVAIAITLVIILTAGLYVLASSTRSTKPPSKASITIEGGSLEMEGDIKIRLGERPR